MLSNFTQKKYITLGREICVLQIDKVEINTACGRQSYLHVLHNYVQKDLKIQILIKQLLTKYKILKKFPQISHTHKKS